MPCGPLPILALRLVVVLVLAVGGCGPGPAEAPPPTSQPTGDRVLLIGVDGASWNVMRPLMASGRLPTFSRLVAEGWSGTLRSLEPMVSPLIWTSIATGKTPEKHGIHGFLGPARDGGPREVPVTSNMRRTEALWTILGRYGRRVNVVGWYVTWPVEAVNGVLVSDRFVPEDRGAILGGRESLSGDQPGVHPAALADTLETLFVRADDFLDPAEREFHQIFRVYPVDATRTAITEYLLQHHPADLTMVFLWGTDSIQHLSWKFYQPDTYLGPRPTDVEIAVGASRIPDYYAEIDGFIARFLPFVGPRDTVLIVSDHGFGPATTHHPTKKDISGDHRLEGVVIAWGNHVRRGVAAEEPSVLDVTPTVLYLLGLPPAADMDGRVITDLVDPSWLREHPVQVLATYEQGTPRGDGHAMPSRVDDDMKERLRRLGYIQ